MGQSGEAAEQVLHLVINGTEEAIKITGEAAYHLIALLAAQFTAKNKNQKLSVGQTKLVNLLREGCPLKIFSLKPDDIKAFEKQAKNYKIHYAIVRDKKTGQVDVVARQSDVDLINRVFRNMGYSKEDMLTHDSDAEAAFSEPERDAKKNSQRGDESERPESGSTNTPETTTETELTTNGTNTEDLPAFARARQRRQDTRPQDEPEPEAPDRAEPPPRRREVSDPETPETESGQPPPRTANAEPTPTPKQTATDKKKSVYDRMDDCRERVKNTPKTPARSKSIKRTKSK